jgi:O-antigen ligase
MQKTTNYLIAITIVFLPTYLIRLSVFGIPTNGLDALIFLTLVSYLVQKKCSPFEFYRKYKAICWGLLAFFVGLLISILVNHNYSVGLGIMKSWFILPIAFVWVVYAEAKSGKNVKDVYIWLYLSMFWVSAASLIFGKITFDGRLQGIFNSPNYLAMYLAPGIIIALSQIKNASSKIKNQIFFLLLSASLAVILVTFYLTYSYAAWVAVMSSLLIALIIKNKQVFEFKKTILTILVLSLLVFSQWNSQKFRDLRMAGERSSLSSRIMIWSSAEKILEDNAFFGIGPGNFQNKYLEYQKYYPPYLEWAVPHPHNLYLAIWLYSGVAGMAGFLAIILLWFKEMAKKEKDAIWLASFAIMMYFLLHGLVDTTYFKNDLAVIFWLNFTILL